MKIQRTLAAIVVAAVAAMAWSPLAGAQEDEQVLRMYTARFLQSNSVAAIAFQVCGGQERCELEPMGDQGILVRAPAAVHVEIAALLADRDVPPPTQEFRVILLNANRGSEMPELPGDAQAALADVRDMTAYTGFELIDSALIRTSGGGSMALGLAGSFQVELYFAGDPREHASLLIERFELGYAPVYWADGDPAEGGGQPFLGDSRTVLSSQFGIDLGETVVVGTSRMNGGDSALVVLLTALDR
jgi:hypothetical protein